MGIAFMAGTTAEVIKLSPVMRRLEALGSPGVLWNTSQHVGGLQNSLIELGLPMPAEEFIDSRHQRSLVRAAQVPLWAGRVLGHAARHRRRLRRQLAQDERRPLLVVHGDTFTTVLGAVVGRILGVQVAHIEAGQRSRRLLHPMPEELNRRLVAQLATLHFAPTESEAANLRREHARGVVVTSGANTAIDALRRTMSVTEGVEGLELPPRFGLVTLHRFELLRNERLFAQTLRELAEASRDIPLLMPAGETERPRIAELGLSGLFDEEHFRLLPKQSHAAFVAMLTRASFVITDSGGLQQECAALGIPCAVHREATESYDGLGENVVLTQHDFGRLRDFFDSWPQLSRASTLEEHHPSEVIVDYLIEQDLA